MRNSTKTFVCLGLIGGTLFSISPEVRAQVTVTGGDFSGPAGFFMPTTGDAIKLLDVSPKTLNIESSIGNTSTAVFEPTAAKFTNAGDLTKVDAADTGILQGLLTGLAYDGNANPVIFTGVQTQLGFTVNTFDVSKTLPNGTLISPEVTGAAPLIFINKQVALTSESETNFNTTAGKLDVGQLKADLDDGTIALPSTFRFSTASGGGSIPLPSFERRVKFHFEGKDIRAEVGTASKPKTDLDISDNDLRFVGGANEKFQIQTIGTPSTAEFKVKGDAGAVDITLGGPFSKIKGSADDIDLTQALDYDIKGQARGSFMAFLAGDRSVTQFQGEASKDVDFKFKQGGDRFEGRADGSVSFLAASGVSSVDDIDFTALTFTPITDPGACGSCSEDTPAITAANVQFVSIEDLLDADENDAEEDFDSPELSDDEYEAIQDQLENEDLDDVSIEIKVFLIGLERYYVVYPGKSFGKGKGNAFGRAKFLCFKQVGPGSSVFPGMISIVPVEEEDIPTTIVVGITELADADIDDTDTSVDESDDAADESVDESDDAADESVDESDDDSDENVDESDDATDTSVDESDDATDDSDDTIVVPGLPEIE